MADTKIMFTYNFIAPLRSALQVIFLRKTHKPFLKSSIEPCLGIKIKLSGYILLHEYWVKSNYICQFLGLARDDIPNNITHCPSIVIGKCA